MKTKKNRSINYLSLAVIMFLMINNTNLNKVSAFETDTSTEMNFEQSSTNFELIGGMATTNCYSYYSTPTLNSESLEHDLTRINIDNLQKYTSVNTNLSTNASQIDETISSSNISEYTCSAPFDTLYQLNLNTTTSNFINYSTAYNLAKGTLTDGVISDLQSDDSNYLEIESTEYNYYANSVSTNASGTLFDETLNLVTIPDNSFASDDHWIQITDAYESQFALSFGMNAIGSATYKIVVEVRFSTSGTPTTNKILIKNALGAISYEEVVSSSNDWYTYTFYVSTYGISEISLVKYQSTMASVIRVDYLYVEKYQNSEIDLSFFSNALNSVNNLATNVVLNLQVTSAIAYDFYINSVLQDTTELDSFKNFTFTISTNNSVNLSLISVENTYSHFDIAIDFLYYYFTPNPVRNVTALNFTYEINSIEYSQNITLKLDSFTGNHTEIFLVYSFDSSILTEYDHVSDLFIPNATQLFLIDLISDISFNISYFLDYSTSEWIVPSETNLKCNDIEISDDSYKSGYVTFVDYPLSLNFTANDDILFNFTILSTFSFNLNLDVISKTYLSKTLILSDYHAITLVTVEYLFDSDIKHSYLNNVDYSTAKSLYPSLNLDPSSSLKIEVILDDSMYLELEKLNRFANSSSILTIKSRATGSLSNVGTSDIQFNLPMSMQLEELQLSISNIRYIQNYLHAEYDIYNTYSERHDYPQFVKTQTSNRDSYNHTENATSSDYFEYQASPTSSKYQTSNRDSYTHVENNTSLDVFENQTIPDINQYYTTNNEFKANFTLYSSNSSECESLDITPIGIVNSRANAFEQTLQIPESAMMNNYTGVNITVQNSSENWNDQMIAYKNANISFENPATSYTNLNLGTCNYTIETDNSLLHNMLRCYSEPDSNFTIQVPNTDTTNLEFSMLFKFIDVAKFSLFDYVQIRFYSEFSYATDPWVALQPLHDDIVHSDINAYGDESTYLHVDSIQSDWIHIRITKTGANWSMIYNNNQSLTQTFTALHDYGVSEIVVRYATNNANDYFYFDNIDLSTSEGYYPNRNAREIIIEDWTHGHYQGAESFTETQINTYPDSIQYTKGTMYVIDEFEGHDNVLTTKATEFDSNAEVSVSLFSYPIYNSTSVEFWSYVNLSNVFDSYIYITSISFLEYNTTYLDDVILGAMRLDSDFDMFSTGDMIFTESKWVHFRFTRSSNQFCAYVDYQLIHNLTVHSETADNDWNYISFLGINDTYLDALDYSASSNYYINRNTDLNHSEAIYARLESITTYNRTGWYQGYDSFDSDIINTAKHTTKTTQINYIINEYQDHTKILNYSFFPNGTWSDQYLYYNENGLASEFEFWINFQTVNNFYFGIMGTASWLNLLKLNSLEVRDGFNNTLYTTFSLNQWYHFRFSYDGSISRIYMNSTLLATYSSGSTSDTFFVLTTQYSNSILLDAVDASYLDSNYFINRNTRLNYSTDLNPILENQNYNHSGHYQGLMSFDNDIAYTETNSFDLKYNSNNDVMFDYIVPEHDSHRNVMYLNYSNDVSSPYQVERYRKTCSNSMPFTFEFWADITNGAFSFLFYNSSIQWFGYMFIYSTECHYINSSWVGTTPITYSSGWNHYRISFSTTSVTITINNVNSISAIISTSDIAFWEIGYEGQFNSAGYFDAFDWTSNEYFINHNMLENQSVELETWNAYPNWNSGYYKYPESDVWGTSGSLQPPFYSYLATHNIQSNYQSHNYPVEINGAGGWNYLRRDFDMLNSVYISFWINLQQTDENLNIMTNHAGSSTSTTLTFSNIGRIAFGNTSATTDVQAYSSNVWYHIILYVNKNAVSSLYIDGILKASTNSDDVLISQIFYFMNSADCYIDSLYIGNSLTDAKKSLLENTTYSMLAMNYTSAPLIEPSIETYSIKNLLDEGSYIYSFDVYNATDTLRSDIFSFSILTNFTQSPYLNIGFEKVTQCGTNATFSIFAEQSIFNVHLVKAFDTITNTNSTLGTSNGTYTYSVYSDISQSYNVTFYIEDTGGYFRSHTIENLFFAKNRTYLNIDYSKMLYQKAENNITTTLTQSIYDLNENRTIVISYPNSTIFETSNNSVISKLDYTTGYFAVNVSYLGSDQYLGCSILRVFEVISAPTPSISVSYSEKVFVGEANLFNISISKTLYDLNFGNFTLGSSNYVESLDSTADTKCYSIVYDVTTIYNAIIFVNDSEGFWTQIDISNLFVTKNRTYMNIDYSKMLYQRAEFNITTNLTQSIYNLNENRTIVIKYPNSTVFESSNNSLISKLVYQTGYYEINVTYPGTNQYLATSILRVFEVISAPTPAISVSFSERINVGEANLFNISISKTLYDLNFGNFTLGSSNYVESLDSTADTKCYSIMYDVTTIYNAILFVNDSEGFWTQINLSNLFVMKNSSEFTFANLYRSYYQNSTVNVSTSLDRNVTIRIYSIYDVLLQTAVNQSIFSIGWNYSGYYRITAEFNDTTNQYLNYSVETYFEVLPLSRSIELSQTVHLTVNSTAIMDNAITLYNLNNSFILSFVADSITTFDLSIVYIMNYTTTVSMLSTNLAEFQFRANTNISSIAITNMTLQNYPTPFQDFVTQGSISENYSISENVLQMTDFINQTLLNNDELSFGFVMFGDNSKFQLDSSISTKDDSVRFREYGLANRTFNNWYIDCSDVNSASITQLRTSIEPTLTNSGNSYYFSTTTLANDIFECDWSLDPSWTITSQIIENNGTFIEVRVEVESAFDLENVTVYFTNPVYYSNWSNATQDYYSKEVAFFTDRISSGTNIFYLNATRAVPIANFGSFTSQPMITLTPNFAAGVTYAGLLQYPEYSEVWAVNASEDWELDGVHYNNITHNLINQTFFCSGYDQSITSSYLQFRSNPLENFTVNVTDSEIIVIIDLTLPLNNCVLEFTANISGNYKILSDGLSKLTEYDGLQYLAYTDLITLEAGQTVLVFEYETYSLSRSWYYAIPILLIGIGGVIWYLYTQRKNDQSKKEFKKPKILRLGKGDN